jgi:ribonuclease HI
VLRLDSGFTAGACYHCQQVLGSKGTAAPTGAGPARLRAAAVCSTRRRYFQVRLADTLQSFQQLKYVLQIHYEASKNGAEYEALIHRLRIAVSLGIKRLLVFGDSKVVIEQVNKEWDCVKDTMDSYYAEIRKLKGHFEEIEFQHVPRNNNVAVDVLSKLGSRRALVPAGVFVQDLRKPSIKLLDPDNPELPQHDQTTAPPRDVLMSEKEDD